MAQARARACALIGMALLGKKHMLDNKTVYVGRVHTRYAGVGLAFT